MLNIHIYPSPFKNESRILKITATLAGFGLFERLRIFGVLEKNLPPFERIDSLREIVRYSKGSKAPKPNLFRKILGTLRWSVKIYRALKSEKVKCINCHSLAVLPLCVILKIRHKAILVYDTHELETETIGSTGIRKLLAKFVEHSLIQFTDCIFVVSDSIKNWYFQNYHHPQIHVIRNVPHSTRDFPENPRYFRSKFNIPMDSVVFLYQGVVGEGRGIEILLRAFSRCTNGKHLVVMGYGEDVNEVKRFSERFANIHFHPAVPPEQLQMFTSAADVGLSIIENKCLSYYYCLPNKVWEYLMAGLPIVVSDFPEMGAIIERFSCGWKIPVSENALQVLVQRMTWEEILLKKRAVLNMQKSFSWEKEMTTLKMIYKNIFRH